MSSHHRAVALADNEPRMHTAAYHYNYLIAKHLTLSFHLLYISHNKIIGTELHINEFFSVITNDDLEKKSTK